MVERDLERSHLSTAFSSSFFEFTFTDTETVRGSQFFFHLTGSSVAEFSIEYAKDIISSESDEIESIDMRYDNGFTLLLKK